MVQDPRARLDMSAQAIEVKHPALLGSVDASVAATGSAAAPALAGELRISRGAIIASGTFAPTGAAAPGAAAAAGPAKPDSAGTTDPAPPGGRAELLRTLHSFKTRGSRATGGDSDPAAAAAEVAAAAATSEDGLDNVSLQEFRVLLGPDLRVTWFPFLQVSLASPGVVLTGPAVPASLRIAGEVELGPGNVNVFATQFSIDRNRRNAVIFHGVRLSAPSCHTSHQRDAHRPRDPLSAVQDLTACTVLKCSPPYPIRTSAPRRRTEHRRAWKPDGDVLIRLDIVR